MTTLNQDQINAVIDWMNTWEQLRDTSIPMRFKEDWQEKLCLEKFADTDGVKVRDVVEKPPLGLKPKRIHDQERRFEIVAAMTRYLEAGKMWPEEWVKELTSLNYHQVKK